MEPEEPNSETKLGTKKSVLYIPVSISTSSEEQ